MTDPNPFTVTTSPITEPESLLVGAFSHWRRLLDYDDDDYSMAYTLTSDVDQSVETISGTYDASNEWWLFEVGSADTSGWTLGTYRWDLKLTRTSDSETVVISTGALELFGSTADRRTHAEIMVRKIESILEGRADHDVESYSIKSRSLTRMSVKELLEWREYYVAEVARTGGSMTTGQQRDKNTVRVRWV